MVNVGGIVSVGGGIGGGGGGSSSGITDINGQTGPSVTLVGTSGIEISPVAPNQINIGFTGSVSKFAASFVGITSGLFTHGLNSMDVIVQVRDAVTGGASVLIPDMIIVENLNQVSLLFNTPQTGRVVII